MQHKQSLSTWTKWLIIAIMPLVGFTIDIYTPALPALTHLLRASESDGKLTIVLFIFGYGFGQLFTGPLSDRYGRKTTLLTSLFLYFIASILAAHAQTITFLFWMRLLQGLAVSGLILNVRAIMADAFEGQKLRKVSIYISTTWALSPMVGPLIGGHLQTYFGWQGCFYFLAGYALIVTLLIWRCLPETNHQPQPLHIKQLIKNYSTLMRSRTYLKNVLGLTLAFSILNVFNVMGPFIIQVRLHQSPLFYGKIAFLIGVVGFFGSLTNKLLVRHFSLNDVIRFCATWMLVTSIASFLLSFWLSLSIGIIIIPTSLILFACLMIYPNFSANCSGMFKEMAGTASAYRGVVSITGTAILMAIMSQLQSSSVFVFFSIYSVLALLLWTVVGGYKKTRSA
jgi:MFS transporter, DHA1 family, multidrug resistance protein